MSDHPMSGQKSPQIFPNPVTGRGRTESIYGSSNADMTDLRLDDDLPCRPHHLPFRKTMITGVDIIRNPAFNKGLAFTENERERLFLHALLPPAVRSQQTQINICLKQVRNMNSDLAKYTFLQQLATENQRLFYALLQQNVTELLPIVYTPTVGAACKQFGSLSTGVTKGLYLNIERDRGHVLQRLQAWPEDLVRAVVFTDGERILGLGDLGAYGMGIPIGKLMLYAACANINPRHLLPITLDTGTDNEDLRSDPNYIGLRQSRTRGKEYDAFVDEVIVALRTRFDSNILIQFEDFANRNAYRLLKKYERNICTFNDDIQGTASVIVAGILASVRVKNAVPISHHRYLFYGAGSAGLGIAELLVTAMLHEEEELAAEQKREPRGEAWARSRIFLMDSKGLIMQNRTYKMALHKHQRNPKTVPHPGTAPSSKEKPSVHVDANVPEHRRLTNALKQRFSVNQDYADLPYTKHLTTAIRRTGATALIGVAAQPDSFDEEVLTTLFEQTRAQNRKAWYEQQVARKRFTDPEGLHHTPAEMLLVEAECVGEVRPIVFALSNPNSKAECSAAAAYEHTKGECIFASGSPWPNGEYKGKPYRPGQGNNCYIFPGIALGVLAAGARRVNDQMFLAASRALASMVTEEDLKYGQIYPTLDRVVEVSARVATEVVQLAYKSELATVFPKPKDAAAFVQRNMYQFDYPYYAPHECKDETKSAQITQKDAPAKPSTGASLTAAALNDGEVKRMDTHFDLVVIGGGSGGLAAAKEAKKLNPKLKVAIFDFITPSPAGTTWGLGGTCVNVGCIPKKIMHYSGLARGVMRDARDLGWRFTVEGEQGTEGKNPNPLGPANHSWETMTERVGEYIGGLNYGYEKALDDAGVKYINALAKFESPNSLSWSDSVNGSKPSVQGSATFDKAVVAVGGRPLSMSWIEGGQHGITSDDIFWKPDEPGRTLVIGGSYIALECAGFLSETGRDVSVAVREKILRGFDTQVAGQIGEFMESQSHIRFLMPYTLTRVERLAVDQDGQPLSPQPKEGCKDVRYRLRCTLSRNAKKQRSSALTDEDLEFFDWADREESDAGYTAREQALLEQRKAARQARVRRARVARKRASKAKQCPKGSLSSSYMVAEFSESDGSDIGEACSGSEAKMSDDKPSETATTTTTTTTTSTFTPTFNASATFNAGASTVTPTFSVGGSSGVTPSFNAGASVSSEGKTDGSQLEWAQTSPDFVPGGGSGPEEITEWFDTVLYAIGRKPLTAELGLDKANVQTYQKGNKLGIGAGKIVVDRFEHSVSNPRVFAIGDVVAGVKDRQELTPVAIKAGVYLARRLFQTPAEAQAGGSQTHPDCNTLSKKQAALVKRSAHGVLWRGPRMYYRYTPTTVFTPVEYGVVGYSQQQAELKYGVENVTVYVSRFGSLEGATRNPFVEMGTHGALLSDVMPPLRSDCFVGRNLFFKKKSEEDGTFYEDYYDKESWGYNAGKAEKDFVQRAKQPNLAKLVCVLVPVEQEEEEKCACKEGCQCTASVKVNSKNPKFTERVVGFHYVGPNAGEVTQGFALAVKKGASKEDFDDLVGIHPTTAEEFTQVNTDYREAETFMKSGGC